MTITSQTNVLWRAIRPSRPGAVAAIGRPTGNAVDSFSGPGASLVVVTETWPPEINGVAHTLSILASGLIAAGDRVTVVRPRQTGTRIDSGPGGIREIAVPGLPIPGYASLRFGLPSTRRLTRLFAEQRPDAVYIATPGPLGASAQRAARRQGIRVVTGFHTNFQQYGQYYSAGPIAWGIWAWLRRFHRRTRLTLVPTEEQRAALEHAGFGTVAVLDRGVDSEHFHPRHRDPDLRQAWGAGPKDPVLIHVGRLAAEKNIGLVIDTWRALRKTRPSLRLVLVGDGPLRRELQAAHPEIHFAGERRGPDLARHYASGDVMLLASLTETFGNVVLEGMASGVAMVTFDYAAGRHHVLDGVSGRLAAYGDAADFQRAARDLLENPGLRETCRRNSREHAVGVQWSNVITSFRTYLLGRGVRSHG